MGNKATKTSKTPAHVSTILLEHTGIKEYEWTFNLPSRSVLQANLALGPSKIYEFKDLKFTTGVLGQLDHSWELKMSSDFVIHIRIWIKKRDDMGFKIHQSEICVFSQQNNIEYDYFKMQEFPISTKKGYYMAEGNVSLPWDINVDSFRIIFRFQCESSPRYITITPSPSYCGKPSATSAAAPGLNAKEFLFNSSLSDVTLNCGGEKFQAHRVVLACRSPVFQKMFENEMKESNEGIVKIKDVEPNVLKELLHFIYTDELTTEEIADDMCQELFKLTEQYGLPTLKAKCAQIILKNISVKNAMEVYMLGDMYNENILKVVAMDLIKRHRVKAMHDPTTFKEFNIRYPEIAFDLVKMPYYD